jgi:hypothetical protein
MLVFGGECGVLIAVASMKQQRVAGLIRHPDLKAARDRRVAGA